MYPVNRAPSKLSTAIAFGLFLCLALAAAPAYAEEGQQEGKTAGSRDDQSEDYRRVDHDRQELKMGSPEV
jgi:hypothetical protein